MQAILVITVDESLVEMVRTVANDLYEVLHIADAAERKPYAPLVIFDVASDPVGASEHIRTMHGRSDSLLVVADAAHAELIPQYVEAGADDVLVKPLHPDLLARRISTEMFHSLGYREMMLHRLLNPLKKIQGYTHLLLYQPAELGNLTDIQQEFVNTIWRESEYLKTRLNAMRDLMMLETGKLGLTFRRVGIGALIEVALKQQSLKDVITSEKQQIVVGLDEQLPPVASDEYRIGQVLDVLLQNAAKYSPPETTITITAKQSGKMVQMAVADQGVGISPTDAPFVFQCFYSGGHELVRFQTGFGVGLYFARYIIRKHGGDIWFESALGKGTTFYFTLPIAQPETA